MNDQVGKKYGLMKTRLASAGGLNSRKYTKLEMKVRI